MNCRKVKKIIAFNGSLHEKKVLPEDVMKHIERCSECRSFYNDMKLVDTSFAFLGKRKFFKGLNGDNSNSKFTKIASVAAILIVALIFTFHFIYQGKSIDVKQKNDIAAVYTFEKSEEMTINLNIAAKSDHENSKVTIFLGEGIRFSIEDERFRNLKEFSKNIKLKKGDNKFSFAVILDSDQKSFVNAWVETDGRKFIHKILIEPNEDGTVKLTYLKPVEGKINA